jgi:adenine phosphoribosyltransferase
VSAALEATIRRHLRAIPDYPKPGILFQDITPVLSEPELLRDVVAQMAEPFMEAGITHVAGIEARGFILGGAVAVALKTGFIPIRKPGKLPWKAVRREYDLEYGTNIVEAHVDAAGPASRVLIVDDVLATGGTAAAAAHLIADLGGIVAGWSFLLELGFLNGKGKLEQAPTNSLVVL